MISRPLSLLPAVIGMAMIAIGIAGFARWQQNDSPEWTVEVSQPLDNVPVGVATNTAIRITNSGSVPIRLVGCPPT